MSHSTILSVISRLVLPTVVVFSIYLLVSGHNAPGGGFIGGLVAGAALVLVWATGGAGAVRAMLPIHPVGILGVGLLVAQATALLGLLLDGAWLASRVIDLRLPVFGDVHIATPLLFDIGVYLVVVGLIGTVLATLGAEEPRETGLSSERASTVGEARG